MIGDIMQPTHLLFVLVIALLVLGPKRLPEVARQLGRGINDFRAAINGDRDDPQPEDDVALASAQAEPAVQPTPSTPPAAAEVPPSTVEETARTPDAQRADEPAEHALGDPSSAHPEPEPSAEDGAVAAPPETATPSDLAGEAPATAAPTGLAHEPPDAAAPNGAAHEPSAPAEKPSDPVI